MRIWYVFFLSICRLPLDPELHVDMLGSVYVNTVDTVSIIIIHSVQSMPVL